MTTMFGNLHVSPLQSAVVCWVPTPARGRAPHIHYLVLIRNSKLQDIFFTLLLHSCSMVLSISALA